MRLRTERPPSGFPAQAQKSERNLSVLTILYLALLPRPLHDPLLDGSLADEPVDRDLLGLTESMRAVHGLLVHGRVPIRVVEYHLSTIEEQCYCNTWAIRIARISD
jgi:hypothetical protein